MDPRPGTPPAAGWAAALAAASMAPLAATTWWYATHAPDVNLTAVALAGTARAARQIVDGRVGGFQLALRHALVLVCGAAASLVGACLLGARVFWVHRGLARAAAAAGALAAVSAIATDLLVTHAVGTLDHGDDTLFALAGGLAALTFTMALPAVLIAAVAVGVTAGRAGGQLWRARDSREQPDVAAAGPEFLPPSSLPSRRGERWPTEHARWRNARRVPPSRPPANVGFCVSGGGIRSACVTLGALQSLREQLLAARYLVSVSGGGYTAGALRLALVPPPLDDPSYRGLRQAATPSDVFQAGSPEEDHLRRHGKYIADGAREWVAALSVVLRGVIVALALVSGVVVVAGLALGRALDAVPLTPLASLRAHLATGRAPAALELRGPVVATIGLVLAGAAVVWLVGLAALTAFGRRFTALAAALRHLVALAALMSVLTVGVPGLCWASVWVAHGLRLGSPAVGVGGGLATVLVTYLGVLVAALWRRRQLVQAGVGVLRRLLGGRAAPDLPARFVPRGVIQYIVVWSVLALLLAVFLLVLGWATLTAVTWPAPLQLAAPAALAVVALSADQTWLSLHPFYRRRLASAFAVRRLAGHGTVLARAYDFAAETTWLDTYAAPPRDDSGAPAFPQVIFAAAAHLSGMERVPPGRHVVSFTFSHDYIGGPDVGYAPTPLARRMASRHLRKDLTVQAAMAISGAAFASAMGRRSQPYEILFALSNARLGSWLPNPGYLAGLATRADWREPRLPFVRRLSYLLREVTRSFPLDDRLLYVTDGGHYENLGLVELLRHGVRTAYCIDASGDSPPFATTLAEAMTLAYEELGIRIELDDPWRLVPGSSAPLDPKDPLAALNARLSRSVVITGKIHYPEPLRFEDGTSGRVGRLIVAKAALTADLPYELLAYSWSDPVFPRDSTSDQWFDHEQFDAYLALGRYIGAKAAKVTAMTESPEG